MASSPSSPKSHASGNSSFSNSRASLPSNLPYSPGGGTPALPPPSSGWNSVEDRLSIFRALFIVESAVLVGAIIIGYLEDLTAVDALYWAATVITTVGYGDIALSQSKSRGLTILYVFVSLGFVTFAFERLQTLVLKNLETSIIAHVNNESAALQTKAGTKYLKLIYSFVSVVAFILVGMAVFMYHEGWSVSDAFFFCVVTLTSVGYGDIFPRSPRGRLFCFFYMITGTIVVGFAISNIVTSALSGRSSVKMWRDLSKHDRRSHRLQQLRQMSGSRDPDSFNLASAGGVPEDAEELHDGEGAGDEELGRSRRLMTSPKVFPAPLDSGFRSGGSSGHSPRHLSPTLATMVVSIMSRRVSTSSSIVVPDDMNVAVRLRLLFRVTYVKLKKLAVRASKVLQSYFVVTVFWLNCLFVGLLVSQAEGWSYLDGVYFMVVTTCTIGYGDLYPHKTYVRVLFAFYMLFAIAGVSLAISHLQSAMVERQMKALTNRVPPAPSRFNSTFTAFWKYRLLIQDASLWILFLLVGAGFYSLSEGWSYADALYFVVISLATIGFGDFAPWTTRGKLVTIFYLPVGLVLAGGVIARASMIMESDNIEKSVEVVAQAKKSVLQRALATKLGYLRVRMKQREVGRSRHLDHQSRRLAAAEGASPGTLSDSLTSSGPRVRLGRVLVSLQEEALD